MSQKSDQGPSVLELKDESSKSPAPTQKYIPGRTLWDLRTPIALPKDPSRMLRAYYALSDMNLSRELVPPAPDRDLGYHSFFAMRADSSIGTDEIPAPASLLEKLSRNPATAPPRRLESKWRFSRQPPLA